MRDRSPAPITAAARFLALVVGSVALSSPLSGYAQPLRESRSAESTARGVVAQQRAALGERDPAPPLAAPRRSDLGFVSLAGILVVVAIGQVYLVRLGLADARRAAQAAEHAAIVADDTLRTTRRPWLLPTGRVSVADTEALHDCANQGGEVAVPFDVMLKNFGVTPAIEIRVWVECVIHSAGCEMPERFDFSRVESVRLPPIAPKRKCRLIVVTRISGGDFVAIRNRRGAKGAAIFGRIEYRSRSGDAEPPHSTEFCLLQQRDTAKLKFALEGPANRCT